MKKALLFCVLILMLAIQCQPAKPEIEFPPTNLSTADLIPMPENIEPTADAFGLDQFTGIYTASNDEPLAAVAEFLAEKIRSKTGLITPINKEDKEGIERYIYLSVEEDPEANKEAYKLVMKRDSIILSASDPEGIFRGVQSLAIDP